MIQVSADVFARGISQAVVPLKIKSDFELTKLKKELARIEQE